MTDDPTETSSRLEIDWLRTIAGALAAVASAVLLSTLGAAGTIIGAALGSIVVTVSSAFFSQGLRSSRRKLARAQASAMQKVGVAQAEVRRAGRADDTQVQDSHLAHADERLAEAHEELDASVADAAPVGWRERLARLPWKRVVLTAVALFVVAIAAITVFELVAGRSVASFTGGSSKDSGTTLGHVRKSGSHDEPKNQPGESPGGSSSGSPSETTAPTATTSPSGSTSPTDSATPTPTESVTPTGTPTPSALEGSASATP